MKRIKNLQSILKIFQNARWFCHPAGLHIFKRSRYIATVCLCSIFCLLIAGCDHHKKTQDKKNTSVVTAKMQSSTQQLFFSGTLAPISTMAVESPVAGVVTALNFVYGERVIEKQKLLTLSSQELVENYRKAVSDFLEKKQAYEMQEASFTGEKALYKAGVVSRNDYESNKAQYDNALLSFLEARYTLQKILKTANLDFSEIEKLSLSDTARVNQVLQRHFDDVAVFSPAAGVALYPQNKSTSSDGDSGSSDGKLSVGSTVKEGQLLLSIGDLSGLSATFDVSEVNVDRIKQGMPVSVTGSAFPGITLTGVVTSVSAQANQDSSNGGEGVSMFAVGIHIPKINSAAMARIRVGMTAKFEIDLHSPPQIMLPVNAVFECGNQSCVHILGADGKEKTVSVITGETTPTEVAITNGLKSGDKVVVHD